SAIARKCNLSRTTVYEYLEMDYEEAFRWVDVLKTRKRKLDPYQDKILEWLKEHPDLTASQISDWLEEHCEFNTVGESTVRTDVKVHHENHHMPKTLTFRQYEAVEELQKGQQKQVNLGEMKVETSEEKKSKLYVIAFVISHSRFKYAAWQEH